MAHVSLHYKAGFEVASGHRRVAMHSKARRRTRAAHHQVMQLYEPTGLRSPTRVTGSMILVHPNGRSRAVNASRRSASRAAVLQTSIPDPEADGMAPMGPLE